MIPPLICSDGSTNAMFSVRRLCKTLPAPARCTSSRSASYNIHTPAAQSAVLARCRSAGSKCPPLLFIPAQKAGLPILYHPGKRADIACHRRHLHQGRLYPFVLGFCLVENALFSGAKLMSMGSNQLRQLSSPQTAGPQCGCGTSSISLGTSSSPTTCSSSVGYFSINRISAG